MKHKKWFERTFDFDLQTWMYPNIVERVRGTPARVEDRTRGLSTDALTKPDDNKWSIQEHIGHLVDLESLWLERLTDFENGNNALTPADLENRKTHEAKHNQTPIEDILTEFRIERAKIVRRLDTYDESFVTRTAKHPRLRTDMRVLDLVFFIAEHDDHHLARITDLIGSGFHAGEQTELQINTVGRFVNAINSHDVDALCDLMTGDHVLVDSGGHVIQGIDHVRKAWDGYFAMFPDYRIAAAETIDKSPWFAVVGSARGTYAVDGALAKENSWSIPAAWLVGVRGDKIHHWQVYADNDPVRRILERHHGG
jgi:ketosteroid isomerase-like protein/uncharacterized damage-inducible protein DinB